jgi:hypothetical protein
VAELGFGRILQIRPKFRSAEFRERNPAIFWTALCLLSFNKSGSVRPVPVLATPAHHYKKYKPDMLDRTLMMRTLCTLRPDLAGTRLTDYTTTVGRLLLQVS